MKGVVKQLHKEGMSLKMISAETGLAYDAIRSRLARDGLRAVHDLHVELKTRVSVMKPGEAVEFLLQVIGNLLPTLEDNVAADAWPHLAHHELKLLRYLKEREGRWCTHEQIISALYYDRPGDAPGSRIVSVYISKLRKKLKPGWSIQTKRRIGYKLQVEEQK